MASSARTLPSTLSFRAAAALPRVVREHLVRPRLAEPVEQLAQHLLRLHDEILVSADREAPRPRDACRARSWCCARSGRSPCRASAQRVMFEATMPPGGAPRRRTRRRGTSSPSDRCARCGSGVLSPSDTLRAARRSGEDGVVEVALQRAELLVRPSEPQVPAPPAPLERITCGALRAHEARLLGTQIAGGLSRMSPAASVPEPMAPMMKMGPLRSIRQDYMPRGELRRSLAGDAKAPACERTPQLVAAEIADRR